MVFVKSQSGRHYSHVAVTFLSRSQHIRAPKKPWKQQRKSHVGFSNATRLHELQQSHGIPIEPQSRLGHSRNVLNRTICRNLVLLAILNPTREMWTFRFQPTTARPPQHTPPHGPGLLLHSPQQPDCPPCAIRCVARLNCCAVLILLVQFTQIRSRRNPENKQVEDHFKAC